MKIGNPSHEDSRSLFGLLRELFRLFYPLYSSLFFPLDLTQRSQIVETNKPEVPDPVALSPHQRRPVVRMLYIAAGSLSLGLAFLGVFVPGLPVTPLALLSAWCYPRSSPRLHHWLLRNKYIGPRIRSYHEKGGISRQGKVWIILFMSAMVLFSAFVVLPPVPMRYVVLSLGLIGGLVVGLWVPTVAK